MSSAKTSSLDRPAWDDYYMALCLLVAQRSPDPHTKHGAVLVDKQHRVLGLGYNGYPRGWNDAEIPTERPAKYRYTIHAEVNCLLTAKSVHDPDTCIMYITGMPCPDCFIKMVQYGIKTMKIGNIKSAMVDAEANEWVSLEATKHGITIWTLRDYGTIRLLEDTIDYHDGKMRT